MKEFIQAIFKKIGIDIDVFNTLMLRTWTIIAGAVTVFVVPAFLSPELQGYYFTFASIIAMQIFFELGLNHVLVQITAHSAAHLHRDEHNQFLGDIKWRVRIAQLIRLSRNWNAAMGSVYFSILLFGGGYFFDKKGFLPFEEWAWIWILLAVASAGNFFLSGRLAICEGLGEVSQIAALRFKQSLVGYIGMWLMLVSGFELWSMIVLPAVSLIGSILWLKSRKLGRSFSEVETLEIHNVVKLKYTVDIFPLQWRIAISWISGYFIFNFMTPIAFSELGAAEAGKIGIALTMFSAISSIGLSWVSAKIPEFSRLIALGNRQSLNQVFVRQTLGSLCATAMILILTILLIKIASFHFSGIEGRLPSIFVLSLLASSTFANVLIFAMAAYMRAHKEEPLLALSCVQAVMTATGVYFVIGRGLTETVLVYSSIIICVSLPWCALVFHKYWRRT